MKPIALLFITKWEQLTVRGSPAVLNGTQYAGSPSSHPPHFWKERHKFHCKQGLAWEKMQNNLFDCTQALWTESEIQLPKPLQGFECGEQTNVWKGDLKQRAVEKNYIVKRVKQKTGFEALFYCLINPRMLSNVTHVKWEQESTSAVKGLEAFHKLKVFETGYWVSALTLATMQK